MPEKKVTIGDLLSSDSMARMAEYVDRNKHKWSGVVLIALENNDASSVEYNSWGMNEIEVVYFLEKMKLHILDGNIEEQEDE